MSIRVTLDKVLSERNLSLTDLGKNIGITLANLSILKTGKARAVRFSTLNALCQELQCQPADLLVFEAEECDIDKHLSNDKNEPEQDHQENTS